MSNILLPQKPRYIEIGKNTAKFEIAGCYPGYGTTLGNALRRVLLSSLEGAAITSVKIKGISHEFSTMEGVKEDFVRIILNLKKILFKMHGNEPLKAVLKAKGEGVITAGDIKCPTGLEIIDPKQIIAHLTEKKAELEMEFEIEKGLGYVAVEQQQKENKEIGVVVLDAIYTPIRRVNYIVEDMRVGKRTDYNKITLEIETDGTITPKEAFQKAVGILIDQFSALSEIEKIKEKIDVVEDFQKEKKEEKEDLKEDPLKIKIIHLKGISSRTLRVLEENGFSQVKDIAKKSEEELKELKGMGEKGIKEIRKAIGEFGLTLK